MYHLEDVQTLLTIQTVTSRHEFLNNDTDSGSYHIGISHSWRVYGTTILSPLNPRLH